MNIWDCKLSNSEKGRFRTRLIKIVENLAQQPHASVSQASGDWENTKATYNFCQSKHIELSGIIDSHQKEH